MEVTTDPDHKFELSLQLDDLNSALEIVRTLNAVEAETKWKLDDDRALAVWRFDLARECFERASHLNSLMLLLTNGDCIGLSKLAGDAEAKGQNNVAFACRLQLEEARKCMIRALEELHL